MRIEAYNQIATMYNATSVKKAATTGLVNGARDEVQISSAGQDYQVAKKAVAEVADIRTDLVAEMKEKLKSGKYEVSTDDFADKLITQFGSLF